MRALTVGSAMIDTIVLVASRNIERMTMANDAVSYLLLEQGRKVEAESVTEHIGGGAVNAAVAMARLGAEAATIVKVGRDAKADKVRARLRAEGVSLDYVVATERDETGAAVMIASHDRNATIFTKRGANTLLAVDDLPRAAFEGRALVYVTALSNDSAQCFPDVAARGKDAGAFVAANPGIRQLTGRGEAFLDHLGSVDLLALNRVEAEALIPALSVRRVSRAPALEVPEGGSADGAPAETPRLIREGLSFGGYDMELASFCAAVQALGCGRVLVTDGAHGAYLADAAGLWFTPTHPAAVRGTAGAGDAFTSTCAALLAQGEDAACVLESAAANAAAVVTEVDTQSGLCDADTLARRRTALPDALRPVCRRWTPDRRRPRWTKGSMGIRR